jgi:O-antigen ligase
MIKLAKIGLVIVLFGQLLYVAAVYYVNFPKPAYAAWSVIYAAVAMLALRNPLPPGDRRIDIRFAICIIWLIFSFAIAGQSSGAGLAVTILMWMVAPYICGRYLGAHMKPVDFQLVYLLGVVMCGLMGIEFLRDPSLFIGVDRLRVFTNDDLKDLQGGTAFYIASLFGGIFTIVMAILSAPRQEVREAGLLPVRAHVVFGAVSLVILVLWGSRGGLLGILVIGGALALRNVNISLARTLFFVCCAAGILFAGYSVLPEERRAFVDQIPAAMASFGQSGVCITDGDSTLVHLTMWAETWRLLQQAPLMGIGASNFGLQWCGDKIEFASPHSLILHILVEVGLIGAIPWLLLVGGVVRLYRRGQARLQGQEKLTARILFFLWVYVFVTEQFSGNIFLDYHFYFFTGLLVPYLLTATDHARRREHLLPAPLGPIVPTS